MTDQDLVIPAQEVRRLLAAACPDAALLYLYLHTGGDAAKAAAKAIESKPVEVKKPAAKAASKVIESKPVEAKKPAAKPAEAKK